VCSSDLHADGEYCADVTRVEFRCLEKKLWLLHEQKGIKVRPETI